MNKLYTWALNALKLQRAISKAKDGSEQSVYSEYVKIGGLVDKNVPVEYEQPIISAEVEESAGGNTFVAEEPAPAKKRGRPAKKK